MLDQPCMGVTAWISSSSTVMESLSRFATSCYFVSKIMERFRTIIFMYFAGMLSISISPSP